MSNYRQTMELIGELYSYPDMDAVLFPLGLAETVRVSEAAGLPPVGDPLSLLWHVFRLGAPLCALFNQLVNTGPNSSKNSTGQNSSSKDGNTKNTSSPAKSSNNNNSNNSNIQMLEVPTVSLAVGLPYTNVSKKCVYAFLVALKTEGLEADFGISDVYRDDIAGFARVRTANSGHARRAEACRNNAQSRSFAAKTRLSAGNPSASRRAHRQQVAAGLRAADHRTHVHCWFGCFERIPADTSGQQRNLKGNRLCNLLERV